MALGVNTISIAVRSALPSVGALLIIGNETLAFQTGTPCTNMLQHASSSSTKV